MESIVQQNKSEHWLCWKELQLWKKLRISIETMVRNYFSLAQVLVELLKSDQKGITFSSLRGVTMAQSPLVQEVLSLLPRSHILVSTSFRSV